MAYHGMLRRSDLSGLQVDDFIGEMRGDATLLVCRAKTEQARLGEVVYPAPDTAPHDGLQRR